MNSHSFETEFPVDDEAEKTAARLRHFSFPNIYTEDNSPNNASSVNSHNDDLSKNYEREVNAYYTYRPTTLPRRVSFENDSDRDNETGCCRCMSPIAYTSYPPPSPSLEGIYTGTDTEGNSVNTDTSTTLGDKRTRGMSHSRTLAVSSPSSDNISAFPRSIESLVPISQKRPILDFAIEALSDDCTTATTPQPYFPFVDTIRDDTNRQIRRNSVDRFSSLSEFAVRYGINIDDTNNFVQEPGSPTISIEAPFY